MAKQLFQLHTPREIVSTALEQCVCVEGGCSLNMAIDPYITKAEFSFGKNGKIHLDFTDVPGKAARKHD